MLFLLMIRNLLTASALALTLATPLSAGGIILDLGNDFEVICSNSLDGSCSDQSYAYVKPGEGLWDVAERRCGDGMKWTSLAEYNNIEGPDYIIHPKQKLSLPYSCK